MNFTDDADSIYLNDGSEKVGYYVAGYVSHKLKKQSKVVFKTYWLFVETVKFGSIFLVIKREFGIPFWST